MLCAIMRQPKTDVPALALGDPLAGPLGEPRRGKALAAACAPYAAPG
jgi:hypothetical protein